MKVYERLARDEDVQNAKGSDQRLSVMQEKLAQKNWRWCRPPTTSPGFRGRGAC
jgi:hypothetical protein